MKIIGNSPERSLNTMKMPQREPIQVISEAPPFVEEIKEKTAEDFLDEYLAENISSNNSEKLELPKLHSATDEIDKLFNELVGEHEEKKRGRLKKE